MSEIPIQPAKQRPKRGQCADFPRLLGDNLCLDFVNTIEGPHGSAPEDFLRSYADVVRWGEHAGVLASGQATALLERAAHSPHAAADSFKQAHALRELLHRIFAALAHRVAPPQAAIDQLHHEYVAALRHARLLPTAQGYDWQWPGAVIELDVVLWWVTRAAIALLGAPEHQRIKECPGAGDCGWLFFDASKNNSRRWCSMEGCGSRVKMRRQYARKRSDEH